MEPSQSPSGLSRNSIHSAEVLPGTPTGPPPPQALLSEGLCCSAAEIRVQHPRDFAGDVAGRGNRGADQAVGAEAVEGGDEAELADLADQLDGPLGVGAGAAEDDRGRVQGAEGAAEALVAEL